MVIYTVQVSDADDVAFSVIAADPNEWVQNVVRNRIEEAREEVVQKAIQKYLESGEQIPTSKDEIILDALDRGWVTLAADRTLNEGL